MPRPAPRPSAGDREMRRPADPAQRLTLLSLPRSDQSTSFAAAPRRGSLGTSIAWMRSSPRALGSLSRSTWAWSVRGHRRPWNGGCVWYRRFPSLFSGDPTAVGDLALDALESVDESARLLDALGWVEESLSTRVVACRRSRTLTRSVSTRWAAWAGRAFVPKRGHPAGVSRPERSGVGVRSWSVRAQPEANGRPRRHRPRLGTIHRRVWRSPRESALAVAKPVAWPSASPLPSASGLPSVSRLPSSSWASLTACPVTRPCCTLRSVAV